jgi:hypothetical protein
MKKTYEQILNFWNEAQSYLVAKKDDKVTRAIMMMVGQPTKKRPGQLSSIFANYNDEAAKIDIKYCHVDPNTKVITRDGNNNLQFTQDSMNKRNAEKAKLKDKEFEFEPCYVNKEDLPADLDDYQIKVFTGFIIE